MPFELIVQDAFTQRLPDNGVRVRQASEHITDPDDIAALKSHFGTVSVWVDEPTPDPVAELQPQAASEVAVQSAAVPDPTPTPVVKPAPAPAPAAKPATPVPAPAPAAS